MFKEIALAGLLHDIGKFYQKSTKTPIDNKGQHPKVSKTFIERYYDFFNKYVDTSIFIELAARHHEHKLHFNEEFLCGYASEEINPYTWLISTADNLSSKERDNEETKEKYYRTAPLNCIFNRININKKDEENQIFKYESNLYDTKDIFPKKESNVNDEDKENEKWRREKLIGDFTEQMDLLVKNPPENFYHLMIVLDRLLKKYLWCIPSSSQDKIADISLYDHLKTTSAIASALYLYQKEEKKIDKKDIKNKKENKYLLLGINFSNIQNYITSISDTNKKGVSKQIRARSFLVDMMIESVCNEILNKLKLPIQNKLMLISGKCYILLPNINAYKNQAQDLLKEIEKDLFDKYKGDICINFSFIEMNFSSFETYGNTITTLSQKLETGKFRPFKNTLTNNEEWNTENFILYNSLQKKNLCTQCNKKLIKNNKTICIECEEQQKIGEKLPKMKYIIFSKNDGFSLFLDNTINLVDSLENLRFDYALQLDDTLDEKKINLPIETKYMANYVPLDANGSICTFEEIAESSEGRNRLSLLKIDIDNLSYIFKEGFKVENENLGSISRVATMSRMLDMFFTGYINDLLKSKYPDTYCIYSGGDNLLLIVPFSKVCRLVQEIYNKFNEYVGQNTDFTISTAIINFPPKTNISIILDKCNEKLNKIKQSSNKIYFLDKIFDLQTFKAIFFVRYKIIRDEIDNDKIDINILRRIKKYSEMYIDFLENKDVMKLMFEPLFNRDIERNYKNISNEFKKYIARLTENAANYEKKNLDLFYAKTLVIYILQITKEERKNG